MTSTAWIAFVLFALVIVLTYLGARRQWASMTILATGGAVAASFLMTLLGLAQGNDALLAIIIGVLLGVVFTVATISIASFFNANDARQQAAGPDATAGQGPADPAD